MNLRKLINNYKNDGYIEADAISKVCQDIILSNIANSKYKNNITVKDGVFMHNISHDKRRATQDLDFVKYSLSDDSIRNFISNISNDDIKISIDGKIEELNHQDYDGKRVYVILKDKYNIL